MRRGWWGGVRRLAAGAVGCAVIVACGAPLGAQEAPAEAPPDAYQQTVRPILERICFSCHSGAEAEAGLDLAQFNSQAEALADPTIWPRVVERINLFEMPPEGSPQGSDVERAQVVGWANAHRPPQTECDQLASDATVRFYGGVVTSRRLTRAEYDNSIRDLTGLDLRPSESFPADGSGGEGFDNVGDTLYMSTVLLEQYLAAAEMVLDRALPGKTGAGANDHESGISPLAPPFEGGGSEILICTPRDGVAPREAARRVVARFARRAFRRPVSDDEVERLLTMFDRAQARGDAFVPSLKLSLQAVLISPHFLFLVEPEADEAGVHPVDHFAMASRLSYFLWNSLPDEELLQLAEQEKLQDDATLRAQVARMLADPRAAGFAEAFATQWLDIGRLGKAVQPDASRFPEFDEELAEAMRAEAVALVGAIFRENRSLLELIDCDYTFVNERLAAHYGLPGVTGAELQRVALASRARGGVLGLGAVLTSTSFPLRTSPVLRGKWVLNEVLGTAVPPPPPDAGELPQDDRVPDGLTLRQRLEEHRKNPECASCHQTMDQLGFGLENFDAIGRWRTENAGQAVDAAGALPSGETFTGPAELKQVLLARKDQFLRSFARRMLGYGLARSLNQFDMCVIDNAMKRLEADGYRSHGLMEEIVLSYQFRHRYTKK